MIHQKRHHLSVIVATSRPKWLANCLQQYRHQVHQLDVDIVVVIEGNIDDFSHVIQEFDVARVFCKEVQGNYGTFAKDYGLAQARGDYVVFWDDDNIYYPHALATLYATAVGYDMGIARAKIMGMQFQEVPSSEQLKKTDIDTMCVCVKRNFAVRESWSSHIGKSTDFVWIYKLSKHDPMINYTKTCIGIHLD